MSFVLLPCFYYFWQQGLKVSTLIHTKYTPKILYIHVFKEAHIPMPGSFNLLKFYRRRTASI